jgi:chaperone BCS1
LFYGPPGTGKSSFSAALAGHLQCDIYHINLASGEISDGSLHRLFLTLPRKCIVVLEDIDSAGIGREQGASTKKPVVEDPQTADFLPSMQLPRMSRRHRTPYAMPPGHSGKRNTITLSGLLNAIDGNASQEGRLLIMTSNNPDVLDHALTRPGRVDKKVYFGNMSKTAGKSIFLRLIGRSALAHDAAHTMAEIEQYATEFADKVPPNTFTPAQVQNFLQGCRGDPIKALAEIDAWVEESRADPQAFATKQSSDTSASVILPSTDVDADDLAREFAEMLEHGSGSDAESTG